MASVYILYSPLLDSYYIGATSVSVQERYSRHLNHYYDNKYTAKADDWVLFFDFDCDSLSQAMKIEKHIKNMKSKKYIQNLRQYPEIIAKLKSRYS